MHLAAPGTFSKSPLMYGFEPELTIIEAKGVEVTLSTGEVLTDWVSGLGSNLLGYSEARWVKAVRGALVHLGGNVSLPTYLEEQTAEKLCNLLGSHVPGWQPDNLSARFAKTGSDATNMAIRLARAVTGRDFVMTFKGHYHGWGAEFTSRTDPAWGILPVGGENYERRMWHKVREVEWGDFNIGGYYRYDDLAAIVFEVGIGEPILGWYNYLRKLCDQTGALLIVDEVVTGLRYGLGGASERYGIKPDLMAVGKALGNGLPISALVGHQDLLAWFSRVDPVFCSSTFWGEALGLAAADYVLDNWTQQKVDYLWALGEPLLASDWPVVGHPARSLFRFTDGYETKFFTTEMRKRGILANRPNFPTIAHSAEDMAILLQAAAEVKGEFDLLESGELARRIDEPARVLFKTR